MVAPKRPGRPPGAGVADATKERILQAAAGVFAEKGYYGAAVDDIVRASDTSKGSFYFHFPSKRGIFTALLDHLTARLLQRVDEAITASGEGVDPAQRLDAALQAVISAFSRRRLLARLLLVEATGLGHATDERLMAVHTRITEFMQGYQDKAVQGARSRPRIPPWRSLCLDGGAQRGGHPLAVHRAARPAGECPAGPARPAAAQRRFQRSQLSPAGRQQHMKPQRRTVLGA